MKVCPHKLQLSLDSHEAWTTFPQPAQYFPSFENTMLRSQTLHMLPAICMDLFSRRVPNPVR